MKGSGTQTASAVPSARAAGMSGNGSSMKVTASGSPPS